MVFVFDVNIGVKQFGKALVIGQLSRDKMFVDMGLCFFAFLKGYWVLFMAIHDCSPGLRDCNGICLLLTAYLFEAADKCIGKFEVGHFLWYTKSAGERLSYGG